MMIGLYWICSMIQNCSIIFKKKIVIKIGQILFLMPISQPCVLYILYCVNV